MQSCLRIIVALLALRACIACAADSSTPTVRGENGSLVYEAAINGDRVPDFSYCGYKSGVEAPPIIATRCSLSPSGGDDTPLIQAAWDHLASLPPDESGWRGALQLNVGEFQVSGTIHLHGKRIVLRGSRDGDRTTVIVATGVSRRPLFVVGDDNSHRNVASADATHRIRITEYVPIGSMSVVLDDTNSFQVGNRVRVVHPSTTEWIDSVEMNRFPSDDGRGSWLDWKPGTVDQEWNRTIVAIEGHRLVLDAPLTSAIDPRVSEAFMVKVERSSDRASTQLGIEQLELISQTNTAINPKDEEHAWDGVRFLSVDDAWARALKFKNFAGSAVHIGRESVRITVTDCQSSEPISEDAGWRRHTFYSLGQQTLFLRCQASSGRHDFAVGPLTSGPNAFVFCKAIDAQGYSGPLGSWATGVLYDNVEVDGAAIALTNRETAAQGTGWAAANCVLWNCVAPEIQCRKPPTGFNLSIGVWGEVVGDGFWSNLNEFVSPDSLYEAQLKERIGLDKARLALSPLPDFPKWQNLNELRLADIAQPPKKIERKPRQLQLKNGWLAIDDELAIGKRKQLSWWRGSVLESKVAEFGPNITRFVPGRDESGYTDRIDEVVEGMKDQGQIALEHHWGLWYDRRRDDHQMIRRTSGEVWPPFYELPWARSGQGKAWDGLSQYDLTRFNTWYFNRLAEFAEEADANGLVLMQYMYFQHNVLEAGAHWADFPWRPANNLQATDFPEPPEYVNRKRIYMADAFYDISHPVRRDLHTRYIRHCLNTLGKYRNVLFVLGEEFTGPAHFVRFWFDTVSEWEHETGRKVLKVLSATRDVEEEILADTRYSSMVDVIDIKYWWYTEDGSLYSPAGGQSLAPRQQLREWKGEKGRSASSIARSIYELRQQWPEKAVICSLAGVDPWSVFIAGGSLVDLPSSTDRSLRSQALSWTPQCDSQAPESLSDYALVSSGVHRLRFGATAPVSEESSEESIAIDRLTGLKQKELNSVSSVPSQNLPSVFWRPMIPGDQ